ncbi:MAG: ABC transporter permease [Nocardiopsis sp. BM-2018]|uniref:ABC transporter permease n=1 Tax=Nocardiopsis metallicus TaxID=179819 RepID=UPI00161EE8DE|nr:ABC transporter permease [Nocardiopsis metallicus]QRN80720.1 MAG: ABC transporter permease [Nocardiopsis sp. BM-2018]
MEVAVASRTLAVWEHRKVVGLLVRRDLKVKYQQSVLGYAWTMLEPLALTMVYWFVFGIVLQADRGMPNDGDVPGGYILFLVAGILPWTIFGSILGEAPRAMITHSKLITTMKVPREIFPMATVSTKFVEYLLTWPVLLIFVFAMGGQFSWVGMFFWLPLAIVLTFMFGLGVTLFLSAVNVLLRDVERLTRILTRILFYGSAILFPAAMVLDSGAPGWAKTIYELNPLMGIFQMHRTVWFSDYAELTPSTLALTSAVVGSILMFVIGYWTFRRLETSVLKEL